VLRAPGLVAGIATLIFSKTAVLCLADPELVGP